MIFFKKKKVVDNGYEMAKARHDALVAKWDRELTLNVVSAAPGFPPQLFTNQQVSSRQRHCCGCGARVQRDRCEYCGGNFYV